MPLTFWFLVIVKTFCWSLIFEAAKIVDLFRLTKGFTDDRIEFGNIKSADILKIGTFIIGGLMIVSNIPELLSQMFWTFIGNDERLNFASKEKYSLTVRGLNIVIGYLLITNINFVTGLLKSKEEVQ